MNSLSSAPFLSLQAGGLACLLAAFVLLLLAGRAERAVSTEMRGPPGGDQHEKPPADRAHALTAAARRDALQTYAFLFALAAAIFLSLEIAGQVHLWLYPAR